MVVVCRFKLWLGGGTVVSLCDYVSTISVASESLTESASLIMTLTGSHSFFYVLAGYAACNMILDVRLST